MYQQGTYLMASFGDLDWSHASNDLKKIQRRYRNNLKVAKYKRCHSREDQAGITLLTMGI